jgi:hypothetical protein
MSSLYYKRERERISNPSYASYTSGKAPIIAGVCLALGVLYLVSRGNASDNSLTNSKFYGIRSTDPNTTEGEGRYVANLSNGGALVLYQSGKAAIEKASEAVPAGGSSRLFQPFITDGKVTQHLFAGSDAYVLPITNKKTGAPAFLKIPTKSTASSQLVMAAADPSWPLGVAIETEVSAGAAQDILGGVDSDWGVAAV